MKNTQIIKIENYCRNFGWNTQRIANNLGIYRLASRISDMKRLGYWIETERVTVTNIDGTTSNIARYKVVKTPVEVMTNAENV